MGLKTRIKNDLWHVNYIIPFTVKYLPAGKLNYIRHAVPVAARLHVVKGRGKSDISADTLELMRQVDLHAGGDSRFFYCLDEHKTIAVRGNILSNFPLDYSRAIHNSFDALADRAIRAGGEYGKKAENIKGAVHVLRDRCMETIRRDNPCFAADMLDDFEQMLERPARHLREALQRVLFFNQFLWQTRHSLNGLGHLDWMLSDFYEADIRDSVLTSESAFDLVCEFLRCLHIAYEYKSSALIGDVGQIIVLGGVDKDGEYVSNNLTGMFLRAQAEVRLPDPKTLLRVSSKMPEELLRTAVECLTARTGSPLFSNDDAVMPELLRFGMPMEDAASYCVSACWEPFIPGKSLDQNNIRTFDFFLPLSRCLKDSDAADYGTLLGQYDEALRQEWSAFLQGLDEFKWACDPFVSMFTDCCSESGRDISEGGAVYSNYGVTTVGLASVCDSLLNLKKIVFEERQYTLRQAERSREGNYKGADGEYAQFRNSPHHFGHDDPEVIDLANHILSVSNDAVRDYVNPLGGKVKFGLSSPNYIKQAKSAPADFAGRKKGAAYGTHISCGDAAYTEIVNFASRLDYGSNGFNGNVIDYFISPGLLENNRDQFARYMMDAVKAGFFQMQMNVMDSATLIDAKAHPGKYPGLIVRVWGFSAYFNDLPMDYKDLLIERALANEAACHEHPTVLPA